MLTKRRILTDKNNNNKDEYCMIKCEYVQTKMRIFQKENG